MQKEKIGKWIKDNYRNKGMYMIMNKGSICKRKE